MLISILVALFGVVSFLFIFWKRLKEDYSSDIIFQSAFLTLVGMVIGFASSRLFFPEWFFWASFLGSLIGIGLSVFKFKLRFYETLEALFLSSIPLVSLMFFKDSVINSSLSSFLAFVISLVLTFLAFWFDMNYKGYSWYKSGRVGFAGFVTTTIFFLVRVIIAILGISVLSFVGKPEVFISGFVTLALLGLLINLGRKE